MKVVIFFLCAVVVAAMNCDFWAPDEFPRPVLVGASRIALVAPIALPILRLKQNEQSNSKSEEKQ